MRVLYCCLLFLGTTVYSQDCKSLNDFTSFHGIRFGKRFPDSLRKYCSIDYNSIRADSTFLIEGDEIKFENKFYQWLNVGLPFSYMAFGAIRDGRIYDVVLQRPFNSSDSISIVNKEYPFFFEKVTEELTSMFGKKTNEESKQGGLTNEIIRSWECEKMRVEFSLGYSPFRIYSLIFTDKLLEKKRLILKYSK